MSVMVISPQMIADVTKKAQSFRDYGFCYEEKRMCDTLAKMNKHDIMQNDNTVRDLFFRLYKWNHYSYELHYCEVFTNADLLQNEFENATNMAKDIDICQFVSICNFLHYNIEEYEFKDSRRTRQMKRDVKLLGEISDEVCRSIVGGLREERGSKWYY